MKTRISAMALLASLWLVHRNALACEGLQTSCDAPGGDYCCDYGKVCRPGGNCTDWIHCNQDDHCLTKSCVDHSCNKCVSDEDCGILGRCEIDGGVCEPKPPTTCKSNFDCKDLVCVYAENADAGVCGPDIVAKDAADFTCSHAPMMSPILAASALGCIAAVLAIIARRRW